MRISVQTIFLVLSLVLGNAAIAQQVANGNCNNIVDGDMGNTWLKTNSAGSGPYKLSSWKPNESVTLISNPDYYAGAPAMERVIVRHVLESASQRLLLERGDIDIARNLNPEDIAGGALESVAVGGRCNQRKCA